MSLLQDPLKALDQIDWYLANQNQEQFPGAFLKAAGNLARQTLEQVLFILAFYGRTPPSKYMKGGFELKVAGAVLKALAEVDPITGKTYLHQARRRSPRIRKLAPSWRVLDRWRDRLNEPSHFRNPASRKRTLESHIRRFVAEMRKVLDSKDNYLIAAAVNELCSGGAFTAYIAKEPDWAPGVMMKVVVTPRLFIRDENGKLSINSPTVQMRILPANEELPLNRSPNTFFMLQHSVGMGIGAQFVDEAGVPLDISNFRSIIERFIATPEGERRMKRRFRKLGFKLVVRRNSGS